MSDGYGAEERVMNTTTDYIQITCVGRLTSEEEASLKAVGAEIGRANSMLGGESVVDILIAISPLILKGLKDIIIQLSKNRRSIHIKAPGFEISDIDRQMAKEVADKLIDRLNQTHRSD